MNNKFYCTRSRLYSYLSERGHKVLETVPNYYNPKFIVWVFEYTDKLQHDVDNYFAAINNK
jgi:hypothetical protein